MRCRHTDSFDYLLLRGRREGSLPTRLIRHTGFSCQWLLLGREFIPMPTVLPWMWSSAGGRKTHIHLSLHGSTLWLQMGIRPGSCSHPQVPVLEPRVSGLWEQLLQRPVRAVTLCFSEPLTLLMSLALDPSATMSSNLTLTHVSAWFPHSKLLMLS